MEKASCLLFFMIAICAMAKATRVGVQPSTPVCWRQRFINTGWYPSCYGFFNVYFYPQQCISDDKCWCVDYAGQSRSVVYHNRNAVDCVQTLKCAPTKVYTKCGSCETTCDERGIIKPCAAVCREGCQCPQGTFVHDNKCVTEDKCPAPTCDQSLNEVYSTCAPHESCEPTCSAPAIQPCLLSCTQRCTCPSGHKRDERNVCVPVDQCPPTCDQSLNEVYSTCAPHESCEPTCGTPADKPCLHICTQRCTCPSGHQRNERNVCVPVDQCPPTCDQSLNEVYNLCAPHEACEPTCGAPAIRPCLLSCTERCTCPSGHKRNERNVCVPSDQCPPTCDQSLNEVYDACAPHESCEPTCGTPADKPCPLICTQRCTCPSGHQRNARNVCVPVDQCPPTCNATLNEVYSSCAPDTSCEPTCGDSGAKICILLCTERCTCPPNHARDEHGVCIPRVQCPVICNGTLNEVFSECAPAAGCEPRCQQTNVVCTLQCTRACTCPEGHSRDENNVCIPTETCKATCNDSLNEAWNDCAPICDATCNKPRKACSLVKSCTKRCACQFGFVRNAENQCVARSTCPKQNPVTVDGLRRCEGNQCYCLDKATGAELAGTRRPRGQYDVNCDFFGDCPAGMTFSTCASACPPTCGNPMPKCVRMCKLDCECPQGTMRASDTNMTCIAVSDCPAPHTCHYMAHTTPQGMPPPSCEADGTWSPTQCYDNATCWCVDERGVMIPNTMTDTPIVSSALPTCADARDCDSSMGKEFNLCATPCDGTCSEPSKACDDQHLCTARCACKPGHVLGPRGTRCIPQQQCPDNSQQVCDSAKNEVFSDCAANCDATCDEPLIRCSLTRICKRRCTCPQGHLRDSNDVCVPFGGCPPQQRSFTKCQREAAEYSNPLLMDAFIPDCEPTSGLYLPRQCYGFLNICWCVDVTTGRELRGSNGGPSWEFTTECASYEEPSSSGDGAPPAPEDIAPPAP